ncbi:MAG: ComEC/Rec2 family competence protein [Desulfitobacteriaceae bacterium]|nr:ComEC/Rec2 family competence protein [Desulfitobacteriaceae bacterium]
MRDLWARRVVALLVGGVGGTFIDRSVGFWILGILGLGLIRSWFWKPQDFWGRIFRPEILLIGAGVFVGFGYGLIVQPELPEPLNLKHIRLSGTLLDWNVLPEKASGLFQIEDGGVEEEILAGLRGQKYRLAVYPETEQQLPAGWEQVQPGDYLTFSARLERPKSPAAPGGYDFRLYNAIRGLQGTLTVQGQATIVAQGKPPLTWSIRKQIKEVLSFWDQTETAVLEGIIFGDSSGISPDFLERYRVTGVLHIFAASGSNVAFVLGLLWLLTGLMPLRLRVIVCAGGLIGYAALCGANFPVIRATILGVAVLMGRLGQGRVQMLRWLLIAALILFVQNPLVLKDLGFQLSFTAAWGIIVLAPKIRSWRVFQNMPGLLSLAISATLAAQITITPLLITAFQRLSLIGLLANLVILLFIGSVFELGLIAVILSFWPLVAAPLFQASLWLLQITNVLLARLALIPWAEVLVLQPGPVFWLSWYGLITIWLTGWDRFAFLVKVYVRKFWRRLLFNPFPSLYPRFLEQRLGHFREEFLKREDDYWPINRKKISWLVIAIIALFLWNPWNQSKDLEVIFLDVGQGDSIIIRTPERHTILVDTGPGSQWFDSGEKIIVPYLLQNGIKNLDAVLLTHEHLDHIGGLEAVLEQIPTDWLGISAVLGERLAAGNGELIFDYLSFCEDLRMLQSRDRVILDSGVFLEVLAPVKVRNGASSDPNNDSLVLKLNYQGKSVLLTGDMEQEEMAEITAAGIDYQADFFKQPHHGSSSSFNESWLNNINPQAVIISVGKNNFGHPAPKVLQYWVQRQVPVYRTDEDGTLKLRIDLRGAELIPGR